MNETDAVRVTITINERHNSGGELNRGEIKNLESVADGIDWAKMLRRALMDDNTTNGLMSRLRVDCGVG